MNDNGNSGNGSKTSSSTPASGNTANNKTNSSNKKLKNALAKYNNNATNNSFLNLVEAVYSSENNRKKSGTYQRIMARKQLREINISISNLKQLQQKIKAIEKIEKATNTRLHRLNNEFNIKRIPYNNGNRTIVVTKAKSKLIKNKKQNVYAKKREANNAARQMRSEGRTAKFNEFKAKAKGLQSRLKDVFSKKPT